MKSVKIKNKVLQIPIIQGGMGVGVSLTKLAKSVMENHGMGVISAAHPGYNEDNFENNSSDINYNSLLRQVREVKESTSTGLLGVNLMVALEDYDKLVEASLIGGADVIISGAGIPLHLPALTKDYDAALAPIVSSGKVAKMLCKKWDRSYNCIPDLIIVEGPLAGGHLGFKVEEIESNIKLEDILLDVFDNIKVFEEKYDRKIPVFVAGGIFDEHDIAKMIKLGASGVQIGTRFIATHEADCDINFKQAIVDCKKEDIVLVKSPVGLPGRALNSPLIQRLKQVNIPVVKCFNCLVPCNPATTSYCISDALIASAKGDYENGLFFCGSLAYKIKEIVSVKQLMNELVSKTDLILE